VPIANPTAEWEPIDSVILSSTVQLTSAVLGGNSLLPFAVTANQKSVAGAIEAALVLDDPGFPELGNLPPGALSDAFTQLSGEAATGVQQALSPMMNPFLVLMLDPFVAGRATFGPALPFATKAPLPPRLTAAYDAVTPKSKGAEFEQRWAAWSAAYGGHRRSEGDLLNVGSHDSRVSAGGAAAGLDYRMSPNTVTGFALSGGNTAWSIANGLGGGGSDVFQAGLYSSMRFGNFFLSGALGYAWHRVETERTVTVIGTDRLSARFNAHSYGMRLEGGLRLAKAGYEITPHAALQMHALRLPGYSEYAALGSNAFALDYGKETTHPVRSELGLWVANRIALSSETSLMLRARGAWAHDWRPDNAAHATFQMLPGSTFIVQGAKPPYDSALASLAAELTFPTGLLLAAKADGEFSRTTQTYVATASARYTW
jgi:uncharacterized protein with beta-barrel porin domain